MCIIVYHYGFIRVFSIMNLNNVSKIKRELIFQAIEIWDQVSYDRSKFFTEMRKNNWSRNTSFYDGSYKTCLWKRSIVVKYAAEPNCRESTCEIEREFEQYTSVPSKLKRYFTRSYIYYNGILIQDKVLKQCTCDCNLSEISREFNNQIWDYKWNHGHSNKGTVKFFDWVYRRAKPWFLSDKPLAENPKPGEFVGW